jgi:glutamine amidotransferase
MKVVILDTGCANLSSLKYAIERLGYQPEITTDEKTIRAADRVFLPGVGSAPAAMAQLKERGLRELIPALTQPVLGICLGMQLLGKASEEGDCETLGIIDAKVKRLNAGDLPLPHMGWNVLTHAAESPLFDGLTGKEYFYFVHSYAMPVGKFTLAQCEYGAVFSAVVKKGNFYGTQFHPEKSAEAGARLLKNFIEKI